MAKSINLGIMKLLKSNKFNSFIEYIFILPLMYLIQYDYKKYSFITLFLSVFILIKNILIMKISYLTDNFKQNKITFQLIYKIIKMCIGIIFFFLQYKYKFLVDYNIWISNLFYLKYFIKFLSTKYSINSIIKLHK